MRVIISFKNDSTDVVDVLEESRKLFCQHFQELSRIEDVIRFLKGDEENLITMIIEDNHVDRQYRDSYYTCFSQKYSLFEKNCVRLVFFQGKVSDSDFMKSDLGETEKKLIGTMVLRPLTVGNIGLTLLDPHKTKLKGYVQTCKFKVMICGRKFTIRSFPYLSQDNETMTCAETALFDLIQYYSEKYSEYRVVMPSEILKEVEDASYQRVLPSLGLDDAQMAKVLQVGNFSPVLYSYEDVPEKFEQLFYCYVESGIPFILELPEHSVVCIGHGEIDFNLCCHCISELVEHRELDAMDYCYLNTASLINGYIFMDDNRTPYWKDSINNLTSFYYENIENNPQSDEKDHIIDSETVYALKIDYDAMLVPLYKRIFLDADRAKVIFDQLFLENAEFITEIQKAYSDFDWGTNPENPLVWRMYLAASNSYKDFRCKTTKSKNLYKYYSTESYPRFIWILEIGTLSTYQKKQSRVEIILDATSSVNSYTWALLSIRYKNHLVFVPSVKKEFLIKCNDPNFIKKNPNFDNSLENFPKYIFNALYRRGDSNNQEFDFVEDVYDAFIHSNLKEI